MRIDKRVKLPAPGPLGAPVVAAVRAALLAGLLTLLLAPWVGMVWQWIAPAPKYVNIDGSVYPVDEDSSEFIAADGWFLIIGLLVGIACGAIGYWRYRRALPAMLVMTAAAYGAAWIARETGQAFGPPEIAQAAVGTVDGDQIVGAIDVRSRIVLLGWPVGVLIAYVSMILGLEKARPRPDPDGSDLEIVEDSDAAEDADETRNQLRLVGPRVRAVPGTDGSRARMERSRASSAEAICNRAAASGASRSDCRSGRSSTIEAATR